MSRPGPSFTSLPRGSSPRPLDEPLRGTEHARPSRAATSLPHRHRHGCSGGSSDPLVLPLQVVERGTGGEARAIEAGRGELFAPQLLARQSDRNGESTRHAVYQPQVRAPALRAVARDRKSTRLNSSHGYISYAVFCLKKKKKQQQR